MSPIARDDMRKKNVKAIAKKEVAMLYEQRLNPSDIFLYIPDSLQRKLSSKEKKLIKDAFYLTVMRYGRQKEDDFLDRMVM